MGVDAIVHLPVDVRVKDVALVLAALTGHKIEKYTYNEHGHSGYWAECEEVKIETTSFPDMAEIILPHTNDLQSEGHFTSYHFESKDGTKTLYPRSTPYWLAVCKKLVIFFGGTMDYQDCDDGEVDFKARKPRKSNSPENDKPWSDFHDAILALTPVTVEDVEAMRPFAAYK